MRPGLALRCRGRDAGALNSGQWGVGRRGGGGGAGGARSVAGAGGAGRDGAQRGGGGSLGPRPRSRPTASRPGSARWRSCGSRPRRAPSCSARWSARTPPAWDRPIEREVVRAMMFLRARSLAMGCSGARPVVAERILALLDAGLTPCRPRVRIARRQRRPRAARPLRARVDRRGVGGGGRRCVACRLRTRSLGPGSSRSS